MPVQDYLDKVKELGFTAYVNKEENLRFYRTYGSRPGYRMEKSDNGIYTFSTYGFEEESEKIHNNVFEVTENNAGRETIEVVSFLLKGGPKKFDLIFVFVINFTTARYWEIEDQPYNQVTFHVPLGTVCNINSTKLSELLPKLFCGGTEGDIGNYYLTPATEARYIREELKSQLVAELMEELEKEIE